MARKALGVSQQEKKAKVDVNQLYTRLNQLVPEYGTLKGKADELKAQVEDGNKEIKRICKELYINNLDVDDCTMNYQFITKQNVD